MKNLAAVLCFFLAVTAIAQVDKDKLALDVNKAEESNTQKLKEYIWKRKSDVSVDGQVKLTTITEFSFGADGKIQAKLVDAESSVKKKPGLRGRAQKSAMEDKAEYVHMLEAFQYFVHNLRQIERMQFQFKPCIARIVKYFPYKIIKN